MSKIVWDQTGERFYETGVNQGVLYPQGINGTYPLGVAWNGLTAVTESPSGAEVTPLYADNIKYLNLVSAEEFGATIEAYTYPEDFAQCDGSAEIADGVMIGQQNRKVFGLSYKTTLGNDVDGNDHGYKLHIIYGALAAPSEKGYSTINDSPEAITFSWEVTTTPVSVNGFKPTASITIDSTKSDKTKLEALEGILYGRANTDPYLPLPDEIAALFEADAPSALALVDIDPASGEEEVAVDSNIVLTFNNKISRESIIVAAMTSISDLLIVGGTKTWDTAGKVLTFKPTENLLGATAYIVTVVGVVDIYGQELSVVSKLFVTGKREVTPVAPTFNDTTGVITIPDVEGVYYKIGNTELVAGPQEPIAEGVEVLVIANADDGYEFSAESVTQWTFEWTEN